jgi:hypothetical protein
MHRLFFATSPSASRLLAASALACAAVLADAPIALALQAAPAAPPAGGAPAAGAPQQDGGNGGRQGGGRRGQGGGPGMFGMGGRGGRMGGMGLQSQMREAFEPDFMRRDVPLFKEQLTLEEPQMAVLEQLMRDYEDAFNPARDEITGQMQDLGRQMMAPMMNPQMQEKWRDSMTKAREQMEQMEAEKGAPLTQEERQQFFRDSMQKLGDEMQKEMKASGAFEEMRTQVGAIVTEFNKWQATKAQLRKTFVDGIQASLSDTQTRKWPAFMRFLAREKTLPRSTMSGEGVNLFAVLDESGLSKETFEKLQPIMDEYELQLDQALTARNDFLASNESKYLESIWKGDQDAAKKFATRSIEMREKVREVNDRYREAICAQLSAEDAARVRKAALSAAYDRVYRSNPVERAFEAALQIEGLDAGVVDSLKALEQQYGTELSPLNDRIAQALRKEEPVQQTEDMVRIVGFMTGDVPMSQMFRGQGGGNAQAESRKLLDDRNTMNDKYMERIKALLTPEQYESLPKQRGDRAGMGNVFAGGGPIKLSDLPQQAQERMKEFDKNNDGTIDDTERAAMVESFRQRGFPGGGGMMFGGGGGQPQDAQGGNGQGGRRGNRGNRGGNGQGGDAPQN